MADPRITFTIEGLHADDGHVRLGAFLYQLQEINTALSQLDKTISGGGRANLFRVVDLSHSSPATVVVEVTSQPGKQDTKNVLVDRFMETFDSIQKGVIPEDMDLQLLGHFRKIAAGVGKDIGAATVANDNKFYDLNEEFVRNIDSVLNAEEGVCTGSIEGILDSINLHGGTNVFHIYPDVGPTKVKCNFGVSLLDRAIEAVHKYISITGTMKYRPRERFPHEIDVEEIDIFPPEDELPNFADLRGIAPDATGDLPAEEFIRELRDGWEA